MVDFSDLVPSEKPTPTQRESLSFDDLIPQREQAATKFGRGLDRGVDWTQQFTGSVIESVGDAVGSETIEGFGRDTAAFNRAQAVSRGPSMTTEDIDGVGSLGSFVGEKLGESAVPMGASIGASALAVGAAGAVVGGPVGAVAGTIIGGGAAFLAQVPYMFGSFRERQKDEDIRAGLPIQVDDGAALAAALPAAALEGVSDVLIAGRLAKVFKPLVESGNILTRVTTNAATGASIESLTEVGQTVLERYQAGLSLTDDEAQNEYFEAAVAGGLVGGTVSGAVSIPAPKVESTDGGTDAAERAALRGDTTSTAPGEVAPDQAAALTDIGAPQPGGDKLRAVMDRIKAQRAAGPQVDETANMTPAQRRAAANPDSESYIAPGRRTPPPAPAVDLTSEQRIAANQQAAAETNTTARPVVTPEVAAAPTWDEWSAMDDAQKRAVVAAGFMPPAPPAAQRTEQVEIPTEQVAPADVPITEGTELDETLLSDTALNEEVPGAEAAGDTLPTVPEAPETLAAQSAALVDRQSKRKAVYIPPETMAEMDADALPTGKNIYTMTLPNGGQLFWNYTKIGLGKKDVEKLYKAGNLGKLLGLGPFNKAEVAASGGEQDLAVREINKDGVAVKDVAATEVTAPEQAAALEAEKDEGSTVEVVPAEQVIAERQNATPQSKAETVKETGKRRSKKEPAPVRTLKDIDPEDVARIEAVANAKPAAPKAEAVKATSKAKEEPAEKPSEKPAGKRTIIIEDKATAQRAADAYDEQSFLRKRAAAEEELRVKKEQELAAKRAELDRKIAENDFKDAEDEATSRIEANRTEASHDAARDKTKIAMAVKAGRLVEQLRASLQAVTGSKAGFRMIKTEGETEVDADFAGAKTVLKQMRDILLEAKKAGIKMGRNVDDTVASPMAFLIDLRTQAVKLEKLPKEMDQGVRLEIIAEVNSAIQDLNAYLVGNDATGIRERRLTEGGIASEGVGGMDTDSFADERSELDRDEEVDESDPDDFELMPSGPDTRAIEIDETLPTFTANVEFDEEGKPVAKAVKTATVEVRKSRAEALRAAKEKAKAAGTTLATRREGSSDANARGLVERDGSEVTLADRTVTLGELRDEVFSPESLLSYVDAVRRFTPAQKTLQRLIGKRLYRALLDVVSDVPVHILPDTYFELYAPNADAYYNAKGDYIAVRQSVMNDPTAAMHAVMHEGSHAAFYHAIRESKQLRAQLERVLGLAREHAAKTGVDPKTYGLSNVDEFLSETWANPKFQEFLGNVPVQEGAQKLLNLKSTEVGIIRSVLDWVKAQLVKALGIREALTSAGYKPNTISGLDAALEIGGKVLELSPRARQRYYADADIGAVGVLPMEIDTKAAAFKRWFGKSKVVTPEGNPLVMYHGSYRDFKEFSPFKGPEAAPKAIFLSANPAFAGKFLGPKKGQFAERTVEGGQIYPVYVRAENPFDYENADHRKQVFDKLTSTMYSANFQKPVIGAIFGGMGDPREPTLASFNEAIGVEENWEKIENRHFQKALKDLGFDGFYVRESGNKSLGVFEPTQIKSIFNQGTFDPDNPEILAMERGVDPDSNEGKLRALGFDAEQARNIAKMIDEDLGGTVTDEEFDAIVGALGKPVGSQQGLTGPSPFMPPSLPPRVTKLLGFGGPLKSGPLSKALLYVMTLDFIDLKFRKLFTDKQGNALSDYVNAAFSYQKIAQDVAALHDLDMADYHDLQREKPQETAKIQKVVAILEATDIDISAGATNDHLKQGNKRKYLQSKKALPEVQALLRSMEPETLALIRRMAENYKKSHDDYMQAVTYTILEGLDTKLSNSDLMRIIDHTVNGKLDAQDKADVNNDEVFDMLQRSEMLKKRKGSYFPAERLGEYVITTDVKIADPGITSVVTKSGRKQVPIKTEIGTGQDGGTVRFSFDYSIRGSRGAVTKKVYDWVANHELPLQSYVVRYRDRQTGEIVGKGDMDVTRDYDMVHEVKLQNKGVHMFENAGDARAFMDQAAKDKASGKLLRHSDALPKHVEEVRSHLIPPGALDVVFKSIDKSSKVTDQYRRDQMKNAIREAMTRNMAGNRYEKRLMGRQNVLGASDDAGRAAANYGRSVGNAIARIRSGGERAEAMERIREIEKARRDERDVGGVVGEIMNELLRRETLTDGPLINNQMLDNLSTLNAIDKLLSPANWFLNMTQVPMNSLPYLGGKFGNVKAARTIISAYQRIGAGGALKSGLKNTGKAVTRVGKSRIDLDDVLGSIRKNVGVKYKDLFDTLIETGDITENVGIENAQQLAGGRGMAGTALVKMDRIMRAMPNAIEAINRSTMAVAAYDLALASGMSKTDAIAYTREAIRRTQFRYDEVNKSMLMRKNPALRFFFTFKQYGQGQYQMLADALQRAMTDATPQERAQARKQLVTLFGIQILAAGVFSFPAIEIIKTAVMLGALLGLGEGWEDEVDDLRKIMRESYGETVESIVSKGLLSNVLQVDLSSRMSWADLILGYPPRSGEKQDVFAWLGQALAGPQGSMVYEFLIAGPRALIEGDYAKGLSLMLPVKAISDTAKAVGAASDGKMSEFDAAAQVVGFKSMRQARISDEIGTRVRDSRSKKKEESDLIADYLNAVTRGDVVKAAAAIREYNANLPEGARKINIGDRNSGLEKRRREAIRMYEE